MSLKPETLALHAGWRRDPATKAVAVPTQLFSATTHARLRRAAE